MKFRFLSNSGGPIFSPIQYPTWVPVKAASQIKTKPSQSGKKESVVARVSPVKNRSESPGRKEVRIKAVSKKIIAVTASAAQSPKVLRIS